MLNKEHIKCIYTNLFAMLEANFNESAIHLDIYTSHYITLVLHYLFYWTPVPTVIYQVIKRIPQCYIPVT